MAQAFCIPLTFLTFILVMAMVAAINPAGSPTHGIWEGLLAACIVSTLCSSTKARVENAMENPPPLVVDCSPEDAYKKIHELLLNTDCASRYWSVSRARKSKRIFGVLGVNDAVWDAEKGQPKDVVNQLRLIAAVRENAAGKTVVRLNYTVKCPGTRSETDEAIQLTTQQITAAFNSSKAKPHLQLVCK